MKKKLVALTMILATLASATAIRKASLSTNVAGGAATATAPTAATDFTTANSLDLSKVEGFRVEVCAASGQTLGGAGSVDAYLTNAFGEVLRGKGADNPISVSATSCGGSACRCQVFPDQWVNGSAAGGRVMYIPNGVTVSGGSTVVVRIYALVGEVR